MKRVHAIILLLALIQPIQLLGQFPEDALRLSTPGFGVGARSLGMGNAYTGVANDFSALYWNPAGLAQMRYGEFSFGLSQLNFKDKSTFFSTQDSYTNNATNLNTLGLTFPAPVRRGSLVLAMGFARQGYFNTGLSFEGFNPISSIIQSYAPNGGVAPADPAGNIAWELFLADTVGGRWRSPILDRVTQRGQVTEGGGVNNWSIGGAVDIGKNLSVGVALTYLSGSYKYNRTYVEQDQRNIYTTAAYPYDFKSLTIEEFIDSDISGTSAKFGLLYRKPDRFRIGIAVKTPSWYHIREDFGTTGRSVLDSVSATVTNMFGPFESSGSGEYDVISPWVFSAGVSAIYRDLVLSGDIDYTDWTQLEFDDANPDLIALNKDFKSIFGATANWRLGLEYDFQELGIRARGGFMYNTSPYTRDQSSRFDQKYITAGLGVLLSESTMLDVAYARGWWDTDRVNYDDTSRVLESITTNNFIMTFSFRY